MKCNVTQTARPQKASNLEVRWPKICICFFPSRYHLSPNTVWILSPFKTAAILPALPVRPADASLSLLPSLWDRVCRSAQLTPPPPPVCRPGVPEGRHRVDIPGAAALHVLGLCAGDPTPGVSAAAAARQPALSAEAAVSGGAVHSRAAAGRRRRRTGLCGAGAVTAGARTGEGQDCVELVLSLLEPGQVRDRGWCRHCWSPDRWGTGLCGAGAVTAGARTGEGQDCVELVLSLLEPGQVGDRTVWSWCCHCWSPDR